MHQMFLSGMEEGGQQLNLKLKKKNLCTWESVADNLKAISWKTDT